MNMYMWSPRRISGMLLLSSIVSNWNPSVSSESNERNVAEKTILPGRLESGWNSWITAFPLRIFYDGPKCATAIAVGSCCRISLLRPSFSFSVNEISTKRFKILSIMGFFSCANWLHRGGLGIGHSSWRPSGLGSHCKKCANNREKLSKNIERRINYI